MNFKKLIARITFHFVLLSAIITSPASAQPDGQKLFKANCAKCHRPDSKLTGPALKGWKSRVPGGDWVYRWVNNSQKVIESGDEYAAKVFKEYNGTPMDPNPQLSNADVDAILA